MVSHLNSSTKLPVTISNDAPMERPILNLHGYKNINSTKKQMRKQLSQKEFHTLYQEPIQQEPTIYHMESLFRDNICDKYELIKKYMNNI